MRRVYLLLLALTAAPLFAAGFEGEMDYEIRQAGSKPHVMHYQIKPPRMRVNMESEKGGQGAMLFVPQEKVVYILSPERKMAIKHTMNAPETAQPKKTAGKKADFTKTSRKETIAGRSCTVYEYDDENSKGEICNAEGMGTFFMGGGKGGVEEAWEKEARIKGLFPLRVTTTGKKSGKTTTMIATRIQEKSLATSLFEVPKDYQVVEGFGGGGNPANAGVGGGPGSPDFAKKMMNATPEERAKMAEQMRKAYGGAGN